MFIFFPGGEKANGSTDSESCARRAGGSLVGLPGDSSRMPTGYPELGLWALLPFLGWGDAVPLLFFV